MKKFLSLVLALVMTMSLVTISAGATEYKDFTDKDEIQYAEAVTVLNKLGIITGYSEGDFRPEGELTRGAAAKILVSLLIGPDAAAALGNETSPYPDVPAGNNFAGVISFCKTSKIISGYGDGTFRPQGTLTGYAFAKMLLGALGYSSDYEGFTGPGWNMKVAKLGGEAGLFDRISFNGNATVTREQACQLALNTIKGTMVEYSGGMNITAGNASIVANPDRNYKSSNQEFATHISNRKASNNPDNAGGNLYTIEFGEEHFVDLRMDYDRNTNDVFGRPANEWSYKKVTIGTFPIEPDYVFTSQTSHLDATDAAKNRATGLGGLKLDDGASAPGYTDFWLNGEKVELNNGNWRAGNPFQGSDAAEFSGKADVADISDLTDNGVTVEVYVSDQTANFITDVVVIKTQLMEIRRVGSDYVALQAYDNGKPDNEEGKRVEGFNQPAINEPVTNVQSEDDAYAVLSGLKAGDIVAVIPVSTDEGGSEYEVFSAYAPEQVKGALTGADTYSTKLGTTKKTVGVTVGGTKYNVAQWSKDLVDVDSDAVKVTKRDVTLYLDAQGNAMLAKDVGSTSDFIIIGNFTSTVVDGRIVTIVNGWDINGEALELNLGAEKNIDAGWNPGDLAYYTNATKNHADWQLKRDGGKSNWNSPNPMKINKEYAVGEVVADDVYEIKSSNVQVNVSNWGGVSGSSVGTALNDYVYTDKSVKFVYVNFNSEGEVDSIEIKSGVQNVKPGEIKQDGNGISTHGAQVAVKKDAVKAVVIKGESNDALASNLMYIRERSGGVEKDENGNMIYKYTVVMMKPNERVDEEVVIYSDDDVDADTFVAYTAKENANYSNFYDLRDHSSLVNRTTGTYQAELASIVSENGSLLYLGNYAKVKGGEDPLTGNENKYGPNAVPEVQRSDADGAVNINGGVNNIVRITNAEIVDLRWDAKTAKPGDREIRSIDDLKWYFKEAGAGIKLDANGNGWLGDEGEKTLEMQLVVNDNPSSDYFREVALIVITNVKPSSNRTNLQKPANSITGLSAVLDAAGLNKSLSTSAKTVLTSEQAGTTNTKKITLTLADANATLAVKSGADTTVSGTMAGPTNGVYEYTLSANIADGQKLTVEVTAEDGTTKTPYTYTFEVPSGLWSNNFVLDNYADAEGYTEATWKNVAAANVKIDSDGKTLVAPLLETGVKDDLEDQIESAMEHLGYTIVSFNPSNKMDGTKWTFAATQEGYPIAKEYEYTPGAAGAKILVRKQATPEAAEVKVIAVKGTTKISAVNGTNALFDSSAVIDNSICDNDGTDDTRVAQANQGDDVVVGHTYTNKVWTAVTYVNVTPAALITGDTTDTTTGKFTQTATKSEGMVDAAANVWYMKDGDKLTITVTMDGANKTATGKTDTITATETGSNLTFTPASVSFVNADTEAKTIVVTAPKVAVVATTVTLKGASGDTPAAP